MKKKLVFIGMVLFALVLTTGTFAYTYAGTSTATINANYIDAVMTTVEPSISPPDWDSILPDGQYYSEILLPVNAGDDTELPSQYPATGEHWDKVAEYSADDLGTYVSTAGSRHWERDLYRLNSYIGLGGEETINGIIVYFRFAADGDYNVRAMASIKTNGDVYDGPTITTNGPDFITETWQLETNPDTEEAWTVEELNQLQAGVTMKGKSKTKAAIATQVFVQVYYEYTQVEGEVPAGELYKVTPHESYTGDLLVKLYLTNTAELLKAYKYINMKVYMANTVEAENDPDYQILSIETGVLTFNIEGGAAADYTLEITGGSYRLMSGDTAEWGAGWNIEPEFYCEVTQR